MFTKKTDEGYRTQRPGVRFRSLAYGDRTHLTEFRLDGGTLIPAHDHPHEQTGYLVSGRLTFTIGSQVFDVGPGDGWSIPGGLSHQVNVLEDAVAIEVFSPLREDYLP